MENLHLIKVTFTNTRIIILSLRYNQRMVLTKNSAKFNTAASKAEHYLKIAGYECNYCESNKTNERYYVTNSFHPFDINRLYNVPKTITTFYE